MEKVMKSQAVRTRNYRKFYGLLSQMPGGVPVEELKEIWVSNFTNGRTASAQEMSNSEFALMIGAIEDQIKENDPKWIRDNAARHRLIGVIRAWRRSRNASEDIKIVKAIACRAAKAKNFNKIPYNKLNSLYGEWNNKYAISEEVSAIVGELDNELSLMN